MQISGDGEIDDIAIVGGGLAGLSLAIQLSGKGRKVVLFEKERYPHHKVCGEYISMESWPFLERLGMDLNALDLPRITQLHVSTPSGYLLKHALQMGGFGISRYLLDDSLYRLACQKGVDVRVSCKVEEVRPSHGHYEIATQEGVCRARLVVGAWGKRSMMDLRLHRSFAEKQKRGLTNYLAVKYHIRREFPADLIELHNFRDGYCGISRVEDGRCCLCYLTTAENLKTFGNIAAMEQAVLYKNPFLKRYFTESEHLFDKPLAISQISFLPKLAVEQQVFMVGDAAGLIAPLCGNGMSMAFRSSVILAQLVESVLVGTLSEADMAKEYQQQWKRVFGTRLLAGRVVQQLFGKEWMTEFFVRSIAPFPSLVNGLVGLTHGKSF